MELGIGLRINNARRTVLARVSGLVLNFANFDHSQSCTDPVKPLIFFASFPLFVEIYFKKRGHLSILPIFLPVLGHLLLKLSLLLIGEHPSQHDKHREWKYIKNCDKDVFIWIKMRFFIFLRIFFSLTYLWAVITFERFDRFGRAKKGWTPLEKLYILVTDFS